MSGRRLVERSERFAAAEEVRRAQTRQGRFEARFLSLDWADANGDTFDYGDCGRAARRPSAPCAQTIPANRIASRQIAHSETPSEGPVPSDFISSAE